MTGFLLAVGVLIGSIALGQFRTRVLTTKLLMGALERDSGLTSSLIYVVSVTVAVVILKLGFNGLPAPMMGTLNLLMGIFLGVHLRRVIQLLQLSKTSLKDYHSAVRNLVTSVSRSVKNRHNVNVSSVTLETWHNGIVAATFAGRRYLVYTKQGFISSDGFSQLSFSDLLKGGFEDEAEVLNSITAAVDG